MYYIIHEISQGLNGIGIYLKQSTRTVAPYHLIRMVASAIEYKTLTDSLLHHILYGSWR